MNAIILLFAAGVLLLAFEVIVPGAVLGILGGLALLTGVIFAFLGFGIGGGLTAFAIAVALVGATLVIEFVILPKTALGKRLFLKAAVHGTSQPVLAETAEFIGKSAEAITVLAPTGYVAIDGKRYEAFSQSGLVTKGTPLRVVGIDNFRLIVSKV